MKVVQINTFSYKAAGNIMMNLHKAMLEQGIDSYVAWGRGRKAENDHEYYMDDDLGVKTHGVYTRLTDKHGFASKNSTRKLLEWIDNIRPDIIHLHCIHGYYINIELLFNYIKKNNIKVVWTQHDCWAFTGHCAYFDAVGCEKWKTGCHDCEQLNTYPASKALDNSKWNWNKKKELFSGLDMTIVTPCNWLSGLMKYSFLGNYPVRVIYNGIDTNVFKPSESDFKKRYGIVDKKVILGVAGEWTERKGLKDFVDISMRMDKYQFIVVGLTREQISHMPNSIIGIERTENIKDLVGLYSMADLFFNPTYEEVFGMVNVESLACGTPVLTYDSGGSPETVDYGINEHVGRVIEKESKRTINTDNVIQELEKMIAQEKNDKECIEFSKRFDVRNMITAYLKLYKDVYHEK